MLATNSLLRFTDATFLAICQVTNSQSIHNKVTKHKANLSLCGHQIPMTRTYYCSEMTDINTDTPVLLLFSIYALVLPSINHPQRHSTQFP